MTPDEPDLRRAEALLRRGQDGDEVLPAEPAPAARDLGARAGFGRAWTSSSVRVAVYLFDSYEAACAAEVLLERQAPEGWRVEGTVNGALLLVATAEATDEDARSILPRLLSSFAGDE